MTLFDTDPQYREKAAIWRMFSLGPLYRRLAGGKVFRWFAINIPMDLGTGGTFTSDIDILALLYDAPTSKEWLYRAWEVKVSLLCKDGSARSLKAGKNRRTMVQLRAYRDFGIPAVSLLDVYVCEAGFMHRVGFPPTSIMAAVRSKAPDLAKDGFGYQMLPFEHGKDGDDDVGLFTLGGRNRRDAETWSTPHDPTINIYTPKRRAAADPFHRLGEHLKDFFEKSPMTSGKSFRQIVFCRECRRLQLISMKDTFECPECNANLILQS